MWVGCVRGVGGVCGTRVGQREEACSAERSVCACVCVWGGEGGGRGCDRERERGEGKKGRVGAEQER